MDGNKRNKKTQRKKKIRPFEADPAKVKHGLFGAWMTASQTPIRNGLWVSHDKS